MDIDKAIDEVYEELSTMSNEDFIKEMEKHRDGEYARILQTIWECRWKK